MFAVALAMRGIYLWSVWDAPSVRYAMGDSQMYHEKAIAILAGDWVAVRAFYQDPLYPYFLAALYALFGDSSVFVLGVQALLGAATAVLVFFVGLGLFGPSRGLLAGLLAAGYGVSLYYDALLLKVSLSLFLVTLALQQALRADELCMGEKSPVRGPRSRWFGAGLAFGLAVLTRGNYLLFVPVLGIWVWRGTGHGARRTAAAGALAAGIALVIFPVTLYNAVISGDFVLVTSQAGQNFYIGNFRGNRSGSYQAPPFVRPHPRHEEEDLRREGELRAGRELSPGELSRFWLREGFAEIRADPAHFVRHGMRKLVLFSNDYEVPDNHSFDYFREELSFLLQLPLPTWGVVFPLALCGMAFAWRDRRAQLLVLYFAVYVVSIVLFYTSSRYRMPLVPVALVFAAEGVLQIGERLSRRRWGRALPALAFLAVAWPLAHQRVVDGDLIVQRYRVKLGIQHARRAETARAAAIEHARHGDSVSGRAARTRDAELSAHAEREFRTALDRWPENEHFQRMFAKHMLRRIDALDSLGDYAAGLEAAQGLAETLPELPAGQARLGAMYARAGQEERAREILERANAKDPDDERVRLELGRLRAAEGKPRKGC